MASREDDYRISEDSDTSTENIISPLAVNSGRNRKPTRARINRTTSDSPPQQNLRPKKKNTHFDSLRDGPVHFSKNSKVTISTTEIANVPMRKEPKINPVVVDGVDDEEEITLDDDNSRSEVEGLHRNIEKARRHSIKGYYEKAGHFVSNESTRRQNIHIEQKDKHGEGVHNKGDAKTNDHRETKEPNKEVQKALKDAKKLELLERIRQPERKTKYRSPVQTRGKTRGDSATKEIPTLEPLKTLTTPKKAGITRLLERKSPFGVNSDEHRIEKAASTKQGCLDEISPTLREKQFEKISKKQASPTCYAELPLDEEHNDMENINLENACDDNLEGHAETIEDPRYSADTQTLTEDEMIDPNLEEEMEENEQAAVAKVPTSKSSNSSDKYKSEYYEGVVQFAEGSSESLESSSLCTNEKKSDSITDVLARPSTSTSDEVFKEHPVKVSLSSSSLNTSKPMTYRSSRRVIDADPFLKIGTDLQSDAISKTYVMQPDLYRPSTNGTDKVMFQVDSLTKDRDVPPPPQPPTPDPKTRFWGVKGFVNLPWDTEYTTRDGIKRGVVIRRELDYAAENGFSTFNDFVCLMRALRTCKHVDALLSYYKKMDTDEKRGSLLELLHGIVKLAKRAPEVITAQLPILQTDEAVLDCSVSLSQEQCASLLACSFLGLFRGAENFNSFCLAILTQLSGPVGFQKLRFILNYFATVIDNMPNGVITFRRVAHKLEDMDISKDKKYEQAMLSRVGMTGKCIEQCHRALQVDFANRYIGGGVIGYGFVQEEIRFLCCPEMMVSMLLCPKMRDNEAIFISGAQQYSNYVDYGDKTQMRPLKEHADQPRDKFRRIMCEVVAIDARDYSRLSTNTQFYRSHVEREIRKAFAGYSTTLKNRPPLATGNWGCGAFRGNLELKCIIQLIAATMAGRDIIYCVFEQENTIASFCDLVKKMKENGVLLGELYDKLVEYRFNRNVSVFDWLRKKFINDSR